MDMTIQTLGKSTRGFSLHLNLACIEHKAACFKPPRKRITFISLKYIFALHSLHFPSIMNLHLCIFSFFWQMYIIAIPILFTKSEPWWDGEGRVVKWAGCVRVEGVQVGIWGYLECVRLTARMPRCYGSQVPRHSSSGGSHSTPIYRVPHLFSLSWREIIHSQRPQGWEDRLNQTRTGRGAGVTVRSATLQ